MLESATSQDPSLVDTLTQYTSISSSQLEELENISNDFDNDEYPFNDSPTFDTETHLDREGGDCLNTGHAQRQWTGFQTSSSSLLEPDERRSMKRKHSGQHEDETSTNRSKRTIF